MRNIGAIIVAFVWCIATTKAHATQPVPLPYSAPVEIGTSAQYLKDPTGALLLSDVMRSRNWTPANNRLLNFGISHSTIWVRFVLDAPRENRDFYLISDYPGIDDLHTFVVYHSDEAAGLDKAMESVPIVKGGVLASRAAFSLQLKRNVRTSVYLKASSAGPVFLPLRLLSFEEAVESQAQFSWEQALAGALLIIILFQSAILWVLDRPSFYLFEIVAALSFIWLGAFYDVLSPLAKIVGIGSIELWHAGIFSLFIALLTATVFVRRVFFPRIKSRVGLQFYRLILVVSSIMATGSLWMDLDTSLSAISSLGLGISLVAVGVLRTTVRQRKLPVSVAISTYLLLMAGFGMAHAVALHFPMIGDEIWMAHSALFGILLQVSVIGALAFYRVMVQQRLLYVTHEKLYHAEKLHTLGDLASGIVSNIKTPLLEIDKVFQRFANEEKVGRLSIEAERLSQKILNYLKSLYVFAYPSRFDERERLSLYDIIEEARTLGVSNDDDIVLINHVEQGIEISGSKTFLTLAILNVVSWFSERLIRPTSGERAEIVFSARKELLSETTEIKVTGVPGIKWVSDFDGEIEDSATTVKKLSISKKILKDHRGTLSIGHDENGHTFVKVSYI